MDFDDADRSFSTTTAQAGTEIASFGFYAPEVYRRENKTAKVDTFSLGCTIFYLLSGGRRPHEEPKQPANKFMLNGNILTGRSYLSSLAHSPEATHMISHMIDIQKELRPTVQWLLDWHPYFWSNRKRFDFLCAIGNEDHRHSIFPPSIITQVLGRGKSAQSGWISALPFHAECESARQGWHQFECSICNGWRSGYIFLVPVP